MSFLSQLQWVSFCDDENYNTNVSSYLNFPAKAVAVAKKCADDHNRRLWIDKNTRFQWNAISFNEYESNWSHSTVADPGSNLEGPIQNVLEWDSFCPALYHLWVLGSLFCPHDGYSVSRWKWELGVLNDWNDDCIRIDLENRSVFLGMNQIFSAHWILMIGHSLRFGVRLFTADLRL